MESRANRSGWHAEQLGDLGRGVAHEVMKHKNSAFFRSETAEGAVELISIDHAEQIVRGCWALDGEYAQVCDPAALARRLADAHVCQDAVEPGAEPVRIAEARQVAPGDHKRVLQGILGPVDVPKDSVRDRVESVAMQVNQVDERLLVAALGRFDEVPIHPTVPGVAPIGGAGPFVSVDPALQALEIRQSRRQAQGGPRP